MTVRRVAGTVLRHVLLWTLIIMLLGPVAIVAVMSFSDDADLRFPPASWGVRQYEVAASDEWIAPLWQSVQVASAVVALVLVLGVLYAIGRRRLGDRRLPGFEMLIIGPIVVPVVAYAVALFGVFADLRLIGKFAGIVLAHAALALPFMILILGAALSRVPPEYEAAARSLGASPLRATLDGLVRAVLPAIAAGCVLAFVTSFDEAVVVSFLSGPSFSTLPLEIFRSLRTGVDPAITAVSTMLMVGSAALGIALSVLRRRQAAVRSPGVGEPTR